MHNYWCIKSYVLLLLHAVLKVSVQILLYKVFFRSTCFDEALINEFRCYEVKIEDIEITILYIYQHIQNCEGRWLSSCCGSVAEHWWLKPEVSWVWLPATASHFTFLYFCLITSKFISFHAAWGKMLWGWSFSFVSSLLMATVHDYQNQMHYHNLTPLFQKWLRHYQLLAYTVHARWFTQSTVRVS